ncbi:hypothetical protein B0H13DRAFT_1858405 [Mycena leptocephala]|nr:hypothetical protein B0H13DRAFT_1858405 [Mycena leptocephala]
MFRFSASFVLALLATSALTAGAAPVQQQARALDLATVCADLTKVEGITTDISNALNVVSGIAGSGTAGIAGVLTTLEGIVSKVDTVEQTILAACGAITGSQSDFGVYFFVLVKCVVAGFGRLRSIFKVEYVRLILSLFTLGIRSAFDPLKFLEIRRHLSAPNGGPTGYALTGTTVINVEAWGASVNQSFQYPVNTDARNESRIIFSRRLTGRKVWNGESGDTTAEMNIAAYTVWPGAVNPSTMEERT